MADVVTRCGTFRYILAPKCDHTEFVIMMPTACMADKVAHLWYIGANIGNTEFASIIPAACMADRLTRSVTFVAY